MKLPKKTYHLEISTFRGISFGAEHWYGNLSYYDEDGEYQRDQIEKQFDMEEAKKLDIKDKGRGTYARAVRLGTNFTNRFNSKEELRKKAVEIVKSFGGELLVEGNQCYVEPKPVLYTTLDLPLDKIQNVVDRYTEFEQTTNKTDDELWDQLDNEYFDYFKPFIIE